jgi:hypothetical protein
MANQLNRLKFPSLNDKEWEEMKREDVEDVCRFLRRLKSLLSKRPVTSQVTISLINR